MLVLLLLFFFFFFVFFFKAAHRAEEIVISAHKAMKEKEGRHLATMKAFELAEKKS